MRTTVDLPDELLRRAKATAALRGQKLKDLIEEALRRTLSPSGEGKQAEEATLPRKPTAHELLKDLIFEGAEGPADLSTNPEYFDDFGR
jgi:hypothetical protein